MSDQFLLLSDVIIYQRAPNGFVAPCRVTLSATSEVPVLRKTILKLNDLSSQYFKIMACVCVLPFFS